MLPAQLLCLLSLGSFLVPATDLADRLSVSLTMVLTMVALRSQVGWDGVGWGGMGRDGADETGRGAEGDGAMGVVMSHHPAHHPTTPPLAGPPRPSPHHAAHRLATPFEGGIRFA